MISKYPKSLGTRYDPGPGVPHFLVLNLGLYKKIGALTLLKTEFIYFPPLEDANPIPPCSSCDPGPSVIIPISDLVLRNLSCIGPHFAAFEFFHSELKLYLPSFDVLVKSSYYPGPGPSIFGLNLYLPLNSNESASLPIGY